MLAAAAGITWHLVPQHCFASLLADLQGICERTISEDRSVLILAAIQEYAPSLVSLLSPTDREQLTTSLMDAYNSGHSVYLRSASLNALTSIACEELWSASVAAQKIAGVVSLEFLPSSLLWITELCTLLQAAASSATSHRHLKQTVLSADTLNATALGCLDQLFVAMPDLRTVLSNSRTRARAGVGSVGSLNQHRALGGTSHAPTANVALDPQPPTETLRSLWRSLKFAHAAEAAHDQMCFHGSPPSALMLSSQVGVKRSVNKHSNMAVLKAFYESFSDIVEHLDKVPRMHLPKILRLISLVWNYEGVSPVATASKLERYITNALQPTRRSRRGTNASPVVSSATIVSGVFNDSTAPHSGGASATSSSLITVDSISVIPVLSSSWFFSAKEKSFEPPAFLLATTVTNAHGEVTVPKGYVLSNGSEGVGLYWDTGRGGSGSQLESEQNMLVAGAMEFVGGALRWWLPRSSEVRRWVVENSSLSPTTRSTVLAAAQALLPPLRRAANAFPFLPDPVGMMRVGGRPVPIFPAHLGWDSPDSLLLRLQCIGDAKRIQPQDADRIVGYLRHLRDKNWYVPAVRTVVALAIAALVTSSPENFLGPASLLLASCRSAAVLHTLEAVHVYDGLRLENQSKSTASCAHEPLVTATDRKLFDAPTDDTLVQRATANELQQHFTTNNAPSTYAVLLSSVVHHVLVNEAPSRIIASLPVLTHAFEYGDSVLPNKAALLDQLAVRVPELPNSWYCGHHVVTCCRVFLVSEIRRLLGTVTATTSSETILMTTAAQVLLDVVLRRFSDLAVAQTAAMIRNVIGHLPLDTVGALLDVSADDVQEVLTVCERPQASRTHDASGAQHTTISIRQSVDKNESSSAATKLPLRSNEIEIPIVLEWAAPSRALGSTEDLSNLSPLQLAQCEPLVGGAVELYAEAPSGWVQQKASRGNFGAPATTSMTTTTQQQPPLHVVPITLLNEHHSTTTCVLRLEVSVCATVALFPLYRAPSGYCAPLGGSDTPQVLTIPFHLFTRNAKFAPFATTPRPDSLDSESLIQLDDADVDMRSVLCDVFGIATTTSTTSGSSQGDGNLCVVLDIVPQQSARVEYDAGSLLVSIAASNPNCLMFVEELLLARLSKQWS